MTRRRIFRTIPFLIIVTALCFAACKLTKDKPLNIGHLEISTSKPKPGEELVISFHEKGVDKEEATYFYLINQNNYPMDIHFDENNQSTIHIPDSAQAIVFSFMKNNAEMTNDSKGYATPLFTNNGEEIVGSQLAIDHFYWNHSIKIGPTLDDDTFFSTINERLEQNNSLEDKWGETRVKAAFLSQSEKAKEFINSLKSTLESKEDKSLHDYVLLSTVYELQDEEEKLDGIIEEASTKYPKSDIAEKRNFYAYYDVKDLSEREKTYQTFRKEFPNSKQYLGYMGQDLARLYSREQNFDKAEEYIDQLDSKSERANTLNTLAWDLAKKEEDLDRAARLSKKSLDLLDEEEEDMKGKPAFYSSRQYKKSLGYSRRMFADTYAFIQMQRGDLKDAVKYQKIAVDEGNDPEMNEKYIDYLLKNQQLEEAHKAAEEFIGSGNATDLIRSAYKDAYTQIHQDANDLTNRLEELEAKAYDHQIKKFKAELINEEAPAFTLTDTEGNSVNLADYKGKTVIVDFWATWCGPCISSFPAMQKVVEKYQDDENIALLFIDTFEDGPTRKEDVIGFIDDNKYDFHVLFDEKAENGRQYKVANDYNVQGIPTKFVIGPDGNIKYKSVGFGGEEKLKQEIDMVIDILHSS